MEDLSSWGLGGDVRDAGRWQTILMANCGSYVSFYNFSSKFSLLSHGDVRAD